MPDFSLVVPQAFRTELEKLVTPIGTNVGLTIVETATGVWSGDAPADRSDGENPITFVPLDPDDPTDPADGTNGIATPANIRSWDRLGPVTVDTL